MRSKIDQVGDLNAETGIDQFWRMDTIGGDENAGKFRITGRFSRLVNFSGHLISPEQF